MNVFAVIILFFALVTNNVIAADPTGKESLIITSNPYPCKTNCGTADPKVSVANIQKQYAWINQQKTNLNIVGVVMPGNLTQTGSSTEFYELFGNGGHIKGLFSTLTVPYFAGLGANDYINYIEKDPGTAIRGIRFLRKHVANMINKKDNFNNVGMVYFDFMQGTLGVTGSTLRTNAVGNLGYTVELGKEKNIFLIQLNGHATADITKNQFEFEGKDTTYSSSYNYITINPVVNWLANRLEYAAQFQNMHPNQAYKNVVVSMNGDSVDPEIIKLLDAYGVKLRFLSGNNGSSSACRERGGSFFCLGYSTTREVYQVEFDYSDPDDVYTSSVVKLKIDPDERGIPVPEFLVPLTKQYPDGVLPKLKRVIMFSHNGGYFDVSAIVKDAESGDILASDTDMDMYKQRIFNNDEKINKANKVKVSFVYNNQEVLGDYATVARDAAYICVITSGYANRGSREYYRLVKQSTMDIAVPKDIHEAGSIANTENQCHDTWYSHAWE